MSEPDPRLVEREKALDTMGEKIYNEHMPRSAPAWDVADPMVKFRIMEQANDVVNEILAVFTPAAPELQGLLMQLQMHMAELRRVPKLSGLQAAAALQATIDLAMNYGEPKREE